MLLKTTVATAAAAALTLVLAGCGSSDSSSSSGDEDILLYQIGPIESQVSSLPFIESGAQAGVAEVNAAGGVAGRKLKLVTCNDKYDPNESLRCAQKAVQDKAVAVVGSLTGFGAQVLPVLEQAEIPSIGADAITPADAKSPINFLFDSGVPGYSAMPEVAKSLLGATKVVSIQNESPSSDTNREFWELGAEAAGVTLGDDIRVPADAIDYTQFLARAESAGADAAVETGSPESTLKLWKAINSSGSELKIVANAGSVSAETVEQAGDAAEGDFVVSGTPNPDESNEWGKQFVAASKKYTPEEKVYSSVGLRAYFSVHLFADVAGTVEGDITNSSVLDAFNKVHDMKFAWIDSLSFDEPGPIKDLPRVVSSITFPARIQGGTFVAQEPFDPFE